MFTLFKRAGQLLTPIITMLMLGSTPLAVNGQEIEVLKDIWPGDYNGSAMNNWMYTANGKLFFTAENEDYGFELWVSDGSGQGTSLLKDIRPGASGSDAGWAGNFASCGNKLFFIANDGTHGYEMWATDGTEAGTYLVKDLYAGNGLGSYSKPGILYTYNGKVYFPGTDSHGTELWCTDGTESGTYMVKDIRPDGASEPSEFCEFNGLLYFSAYDGQQNVTGHSRELWVTDGTEAGTHLFKDIAPVQVSEGPQYLTVCGDKMFFTTDDATHGKELWATDGTDAGTYLVKDIKSGTGGSYPKYLTVLDDILYFSAAATGNIYTFWRSDGTETGTFQIAPNLQDPINLKVFQDKIFLIAANTYAGGNIGNYELYSYSEATGATLIKEINPDPTVGIDFNPGSNFPEGFIEYNNKLYFRAANDGYYTTLWQTDGTEEGTIETPNQNSAVENPLSAEFFTAFTFLGYNGSLYYPALYQVEVSMEVYKLTAEPGTYQVTGSGSYCQSGTGLPVGLTGSDIGVTYTLYKDGVAVASGVAGTGAPLSFGNWLAGTYTIEGTNTIGTVTMAGGAVIVAEDQLPVSVTLQTPQTSVCTGQTVTITATPVNGGNPSYEWFINGSATGTNQPTYTFVPVNGDQVYCIMTSDLECVSGNPATSNTITVTVNDILPASVTIDPQPEGCAGEQFTVTANPVNGGNAIYEWYVNGSIVTTSTLPNYTFGPSNGDQVYVVMTSGLTCATGSPATSNTVALTVNQPVTPVVTITANPNPVPAGSAVEFSPTPYNGGTPTYKWFVNDILSGDGNTFYYIPSNLDKVYCEMTSSLECVTASTVTSNVIFIDVIIGIGGQPEKGMIVYAKGKTIVIGSSSPITGIATLTGLSGKTLYRFDLSNTMHEELPTQLTEGIYLLKIKTQNKESVIKIILY